LCVWMHFSVQLIHLMGRTKNSLHAYLRSFTKICRKKRNLHQLVIHVYILEKKHPPRTTWALRQAIALPMRGQALCLGFGSGVCPHLMVLCDRGSIVSCLMQSIVSPSHHTLENCSNHSSVHLAGTVLRLLTSPHGSAKCLSQLMCRSLDAGRSAEPSIGRKKSSTRCA
jgi:hypothetical protein